MGSVGARLSALEKDTEEIKKSVRESREKWDAVELAFKEVILEFCHEYHLKIPERILK